MSEKTKQIDRILRYIEEMGSITPLEALRELGVMRLASRMSDIKSMGYNIEKSWVTAVNKWGEPVRYMRYAIKKEETQ